MRMKVKAVEKLLKFNKNENDPGVWHSLIRTSDLRSKVGCISEKKEKLVFLWFFSRFALPLST